MRLRYFSSVLITGILIYGIGLELGAYWFVFAFIFHGFVTKPLIDYYFIRKRNLTHGKSLPWHFPLTQQYTWDLLFKKDEEEKDTTASTKPE